MSKIGWLDTGSGSGGDHEAEAEERVEKAATELNEPLLYEAVVIYNGVFNYSELPDEFLGPAKRFVEFFRREQVCLNDGVDSLDYVRECVRRSFGIASIVPHGPECQKRRHVTDEQIEKIAVKLVALGYVLPPKA